MRQMSGKGFVETDVTEPEGAERCVWWRLAGEAGKGSTFAEDHDCLLGPN
jgi:hypothetical protein